MSEGSGWQAGGGGRPTRKQGKGEQEGNRVEEEGSGVAVLVAVGQDSVERCHVAVVRVDLQHVSNIDRQRPCHRAAPCACVGACREQGVG